MSSDTVRLGCRVWTTNDFTGAYPVPTAAVVVAATEEDAKALLTAELISFGLKFDGTLVELPTIGERVRVLSDGDY